MDTYETLRLKNCVYHLHSELLTGARTFYSAINAVDYASAVNLICNHVIELYVVSVQQLVVTTHLNFGEKKLFFHIHRFLQNFINISI
jgi:hypothetical protein